MIYDLIISIINTQRHSSKDKVDDKYKCQEDIWTCESGFIDSVLIFELYYQSLITIEFDIIM